MHMIHDNGEFEILLNFIPNENMANCGTVDGSAGNLNFSQKSQLVVSETVFPKTAELLLHLQNS